MKRKSKIKCAIALLACSMVVSVQAASIQDARSLYLEGKYPAALKQTESLLTDSPDDVPALFLKAQIQSENQGIDAAINTYKRLLVLAPVHLQAYNNLAALYAQQGKLELASQTLEKAIQTDPVFTTIHTNLRAIYLDMSQKHYRQALKLETEDAPTQIASIDLYEGVDQILSQEIQVVPQSVQDAINTSVPSGPSPVVRPPAPVVATAAPVPKKKVSEPVSKVTKPVKKPQPVTTVTPAAAAVKPAASKVDKAPETRPVPKQVEDPALDVKKALLTWANAWSNRDATRYVNAYTNNYATQGKTNKDWAAGRRWNFKTKKYIKVALSGIRIQADGKQFRAYFKQRYESDSYKDEVKKELLFVRQGGRWKIAKEVSS